MIRRYLSPVLLSSLAIVCSAPAWAQLSPFSEDFEGLDQMSATALGDTGWIVFGNVFDSGGNYLFGYGPNAAPNGGPAFSAVVIGEGGADQGAQQLSIYNDYNCCQPSNGHFNGTDRVESNVFQERTIAAGDEGVWVFKFDAKRGNIADASTAEAFVKTLDPNAGFVTTSVGTIDTTDLDSSWSTFSIAINIDASKVGQILQFGFASRATNFESSGVFYDNLDFAPFSGAVDAEYSQDFEGLDQMSATVLGDDGWIVFGNVFDSGGNYLFGYGPNAAPNGGPAFSAVVIGEGGPDQGAQQLSIYNDYNCCQPSNGHFNGTDRVESNVFQERVIGAEDTGSRIFVFDAKRGNIAGASTAQAFVKTLDPNAGFVTTSSAVIDTTDLPSTWDTFSIAVNIDAAKVGQILQFGFASTASNFESSGVFYDNLKFGPPGMAVDSDGDGVSDNADNCVLFDNPLQVDTDGDGIGNACDPDYNQDCLVNFFDLGSLKGGFFLSDPNLDLTGVTGGDPDGAVNFSDLGRLKALVFRNYFDPADNPSGISNLCIP